MSGKYDDIINLEHYEPKYHKRMSTYKRASQFASFQALTGYSDLIKETGRITTKKKDLSIDSINKINYLIESLSNSKECSKIVSITYFVKDSKKDGGKYITISDYIKKIDSVYKIIYMSSGLKVNVSDILNIEILDN